MFNYASNTEFASNCSCLELVSICKQEDDIAKLPRTLHMHDDYLELVFVKKGSGTYTIDGSNYTTNDGDILIYNAGVLHDEHHIVECLNGKNEIFGCSIKGLFISGLPNNHLIDESTIPKVETAENYSAILSLFLLLESYWDGKNVANKQLIHHLLTSLLLLVLESGRSGVHYKEKNKIKEIGEIIKLYLDEYYWDEVVLSDLAKKLHITPFYLSHVFKKYSGYSPLQYLTRRRVGESQTLLIHSKDNLTKICRAVGFDNVTYFQKVFLRYVGVSPKEYREKKGFFS